MLGYSLRSSQHRLPDSRSRPAGSSEELQLTAAGQYCSLEMDVKSHIQGEHLEILRICAEFSTFLRGIEYIYM